jgi:hypothetical protein
MSTRDEHFQWIWLELQVIYCAEARTTFAADVKRVAADGVLLAAKALQVPIPNTSIHLLCTLIRMMGVGKGAGKGAGTGVRAIPNIKP